MNEDDDGRLRPVLVGLGALVGVSLLVGAVVSLVALGVADVTGVSGGDDPGRATSAESSLYMPSPSNSKKPAPEQSKPAEEPGEAEPSEKEGSVPLITLSAGPSSVSTFDRIYLRGTYRDADGATLQVQRFEGGWADFPATATVQNGTFETYVESGQGGANRFRVLDESADLSSKPVSVDVG